MKAWLFCQFCMDSMAYLGSAPGRANKGYERLGCAIGASKSKG